MARDSTRSSQSVGRQPILLQITDATLAAGPVGQPLPTHTQALFDPAPSNGEALYSFLADPLTSLFHRLLGTKIAAGVIVLHSQGIYMNEGWKLAISRLLNDLLKVTSVCYLSTLHCLPAVISHSHTVLAVHISDREFQCMITAVDHDPLEYTFQSVPLDASYRAVVRALCLSLLACPRSHRKAAIQNILVDDKDHAKRIVRHLYDFLTNDNLQRNTDDDNDDGVQVPISRDEIKILAPFIGLVDFKSTFRLAYLSTSVLASCQPGALRWQDISSA